MSFPGPHCKSLRYAHGRQIPNAIMTQQATGTIRQRRYLPTFEGSPGETAGGTQLRLISTRRQVVHGVALGFPRNIRDWALRLAGETRRMTPIWRNIQSVSKSNGLSMICHRHLAQRNDKQSMTWAPQERITNRPLEKLARQRRTECDMTGSRLPHIYCAVLPATTYHSLLLLPTAVQRTPSQVKKAACVHCDSHGQQSPFLLVFSPLKLTRLTSSLLFNFRLLLFQNQIFFAHD